MVTSHQVPSVGVNFWGPQGWRFMHTVSFYYPETPSREDQYAYCAFFRTVGEVLPCPYCRKHYKAYVSANPPEKKMANWQQLSRWLVDLHNVVNARHGKPHFSYDRALKLYRPHKESATKGEGGKPNPKPDGKSGCGKPDGCGKSGILSGGCAGTLFKVTSCALMAVVLGGFLLLFVNYLRLRGS